MDKAKNRAETIGLIILGVCLFIELPIIYQAFKTDSGIYRFFGLLVLTIGMLGYFATRVYSAKPRKIAKINTMLEQLNLTHEEIGKRQDYLSNQTMEKLVELEEVLYRELEPKQKPKQKQMSDEEFFKPLFKKKENE
ncbi:MULTISPECIES: hypothetical protein [Staphylococcus]|uniref:Uncharacterized protein n=1 Tax=Staphylococcus equorum TaxID=246432 RepID=A0AAP7IF40_9STAP|nr:MULTISPECIES: hypothetical protein [Staphylococcus]OEK58825.1 hypothetical protein ASS94_01340 [Staphylococcus equorum]PTK44969.1 hypothetical protein BUZ69_12250 [Staphylococcus saprophyticus]